MIKQLIKAYNRIMSTHPTLRPAVAMELAKAKISPKKTTRGIGVINRKEHGR